MTAGCQTDDARFPEVLATAIRASGQSLAQLSQALREQGSTVSGATLSYWQTGRSVPTRRPSQRAVLHLEQVLALEPGTLVRLLPRRTAATWSPARASGCTPEVLAALDRLDLDPRDRFEHRYVHDHVHVDARRTCQVETTRHLIVAQRDQLDRIPVLYRHPAGAQPAPRIAAGNGCTLGRVARLDDDGLHVAELLLPAPLAAGQRHVFDYCLRWMLPGGGRDGRFSRVLPVDVPMYVITTQLDGEPPLSATYRSAPYTCPQAGDPLDDADLDSTPLEPGNCLQVCLPDAHAGVHRLHWTHGGDR